MRGMGAQVCVIWELQKPIIQKTNGICSLCGGVFGKIAMKKHIVQCLQKHPSRKPSELRYLQEMRRRWSGVIRVEKSQHIFAGIAAIQDMAGLECVDIRDWIELG